MTAQDALTPLMGHLVSAEIGDQFTVFGTLFSADEHWLIFVEADLHNQAEANSNRDIYALESRDLGIRANRRRLLVPRWRLICISPLDDVCA